MKSFLENNYEKIKEKSISGRWIRIKDIEPLFDNLADCISIKQLGVSEENLPIYHLKLGEGNKKILIWSQMHGNESTGTKAVFDLLNFFKLFPKEEITTTILNNCTIEIIPILNPDGAEKYTRVNANGIDLNRDAVAIEAKESKLLRNVLDEFNPKFCFNLHDQRTIFGVEGTNKPATISFLAPSEEETRKVTKGRTETMNVIVAMNELLQEFIPNSVGRYTDEFYPTATGDNFQKLGHNTILIEAGHYPNDYEREETRKYNFYALLKGIHHIATSNSFLTYKDYFNIPNNSKSFYDLIVKNSDNSNYAYQYKETIIEDHFVFHLEKINEGNLSGFLYHKLINLS